MYRSLKSKDRKIFFCVISAMIISVVVGILIYQNSDTVKLGKQLDLGQKYLSEANYDSAIVTFEAVIKTEPRNVEAYLGLAYAYVGKKDLGKAIEVLQSGYEMTGDVRLKQNLEKIKAEYEMTKEIQTEEVVVKKMKLKEFVEAPTIIGKHWSEVSLQEFYDYYNVAPPNTLYELNDKCRVIYQWETQGNIRYFDDTFGSAEAYIQSQQGNYQYIVSKSLIAEEIDFRIVEGYSDYMIKYKIDSLEDFLKVWNADEASEEVIQTLEQIRNNENTSDFYTMDFQSDLGEVSISLQDAGTEIRMNVYFRNKESKAEHIGIDEDEDDIHILYFFQER